uniref:Uncharacterized protein n=1 Tax=Romanomermis culicivorax TaxID=13658 RepID=A0A915KLU8_ROMCU
MQSTEKHVPASIFAAVVWVPATSALGTGQIPDSAGFGYQNPKYSSRRKPSVSSSSESSDESESTSSTSGSSSSDSAENASDTLANEERIRENAAGTIGWPVEGPSQMDDEEDDQGQPSPADWNLGGKVQLKKKSAAQKRRERQKRTAQMHRTLQSGQFWKIREMQKEKYGF